MVISCETCSRPRSSACDDCVVAHVLGADGRAEVVDLATERAVRLLIDAGMVSPEGERHAG